MAEFTCPICGSRLTLIVETTYSVHPITGEIKPLYHPTMEFGCPNEHQVPFRPNLKTWKVEYYDREGEAERRTQERMMGGKD